MNDKQIKNQRSKIANKAMSCDEIQQSLSLYVDDGLRPEERGVCYRHLESCPVCRARLAEVRAIRSGLAMLSRPAPPAALVPSINKALMARAATQEAIQTETFGDVISIWLQPLMMRYVFSSLASIIIFGSVFSAMRPQMVALHEAVVVLDQVPVSLEVPDPFRSGYDINKPISPESYSALRAPFTTESPSLNPGGALATLTSEPSRPRGSGREGDDNMMVVADVFTNGSASLADVMQAPRDRRMLRDFDKALRENAAFVPAALDRRPETMRVVFSIQRVDVYDRNY